MAAKSGFGRGGMGTKCGIARKVAAEGVAVIIAKGDRPGVLVDLVKNPADVPHTVFEPSDEPLSTIKRWIAHSGSFAKGSITVNDQAAEILRSDRAVSLLPIGAVEIEGDWEEGDIVAVRTSAGEQIGVGRACMTSQEALETLGQHGCKPLIHYDYLYIENL